MVRLQALFQNDPCVQVLQVRTGQTLSANEQSGVSVSFERKPPRSRETPRGGPQRPGHFGVNMGEHPRSRRLRARSDSHERCSGCLAAFAS